MADKSREQLDHLDPGGRVLARYLGHPALVVYVTVGLLLLISWGVVALMSVRAAQVFGGTTAGPGIAYLEFLPAIALPAFMEAFFALCLSPAPVDVQGFPSFAALAAMWFFMSLAMMLPSAAPMIRTYCEIADTAAGKGEMAVHPAILISGYIAVWAGAAIGFAVLAAAIDRFGLGGEAPAVPVLPLAGAVVLAIAGLYQFSSLKESCLTKCRNPFAILFSRWSTRTRSVFILGIEQGLYCLGCCWALMLVMFAVGVMNVFWMAFLAVFAVFEKGRSGRLITHASGVLLLVWAAALLFSHWQN